MTFLVGVIILGQQTFVAEHASWPLVVVGTTLLGAPLVLPRLPEKESWDKTP
ncbi:MAG: hypothetical protein HOV87_12010 [Catenulispora sp.]|nr:hypothetical protein [Catenulispora sp.]NUT40025.1 hypothetical protein [Thermoactinospora sp.]